MKIFKILIVVFLFTVFLPISSQAESGKIAAINTAAVLDSFYKTKKVYKELEAKGKAKSDERDKMIEELNKLKDGAALLSKEGRRKKEDELSKKTRELQDFDRNAQIELKREQNDALKNILKEIDDGIKKFGKDNGFEMIFDDRVFVYIDDAIDITSAVVEELNKGR